MHVDWRWIKQRPHFLAEQVSRKRRVLVLYRLNPRRFWISRNRSGVRRLPFVPIPSKGVSALKLMNGVAQRAWLWIICLIYRPTIIWVTFPTLYEYIPRRFAELPIVYDCMDDAAAFSSAPATRTAIRQMEKRLVNQASVVICSSQHLVDDVSRRYEAKNKAVLIRNALPDALASRMERWGTVIPAKNKITLDIAYFGTISDWIDFSLLCWCLDQMPGLRIHLIGPLSTDPIRCRRLSYHPPIDHSVLMREVQGYDGFIVPFHISPLIHAVDPVKLYEYLALGREVFVRFYPELERFRSFVHFYETPKQIYELLTRFERGELPRKAGTLAVDSFLKGNTWAVRGQLVEQVLENITGGAQRS